MSDQERARIRVRPEDKRRLTERKRGDETQADVVQRLLDETPDVTVAVDHEDLTKAINQSLWDESLGGPEYDDLVRASREAIRQELPTEAFRS